ncbi:MAG: hypothetical protein Q8R40_01260 [bacterium]|nr:hypothetical protein [bacterium]
MFSEKFERSFAPEERQAPHWHDHHPCVPSGGHPLDMGHQAGLEFIPIIRTIGILAAISAVIMILLS